MPQFVVTQTKANLSTYGSNSSLGAGSVLSLDDVVLNYINTSGVGVYLEGLEDDGSSWSRAKTEEGTTVDTNFSVNPMLVPNVPLNSGALRIRNSTAGAVDYTIGYWSVG